MIRHGAPVPRRASVGKIPAAAYRSMVDMDWLRIVAVSVVAGISPTLSPTLQVLWRFHAFAESGACPAATILTST